MNEYEGDIMPELSWFYNIVIKMLFKDMVQHNKPHVRVFYNEYEASVGIDGELLAGSLPVKEMRLVMAWLTISEEELYAAWNKAVSGILFEKIKDTDIKIKFKAKQLKRRTLHRIFKQSGLVMKGDDYA